MRHFLSINTCVISIKLILTEAFKLKFLFGKMKNILLPTDFSENARQAILFGISLFENVPCNFYLLHTFTPAAYHSGKAFKYFNSVDLVQAKKNTVEESLIELKEQLEEEKKHSQHTFTTLSAFNLLVDEIRKQVKEKRIDLIVMGTQGATGAKEIFLGTNTMYTIQKVNCPVIAVPFNTTFHRPDEILFVTDYKTIRNEDLEIIKFLVELSSGKLHILHVYNYEPLDAFQKERKNLLENYFEKPNPRFHLSEEQDIPEAIEAFKEKNEIDLIVMVQKKHSFFENLFFKPIINEMVFHSQVPLMILPAEYPAS